MKQTINMIRTVPYSILDYFFVFYCSTCIYM